MGIPPGRWDEKDESHSQRKAVCFALDVVLGVGALGENTPHSHSPSFVLTLIQGFLGSISSQEPLQRTPFSCLNAPTLLCFSGMCFHLKTTLNGALPPPPPRFKN